MTGASRTPRGALTPRGSEPACILPLARSAMGTRFELVLAGNDEVRLRAAGEEALDEIEGAHARFTLFERNSVLAHVNRSAARDWVPLDGETFELFALADTAWRQSRGAFDPTVSPWIASIKEHPSRAGRDESAPVGWEHVILDPEGLRVRFARPGVAVDFGGIAKGHGLDLAARALAEAGIESAILHGGTSSTIAIGAPPGQPGWRIALGDGAEVPTLCLRDATLSTSAPRGRRVGGFSHVIDPSRRVGACRVHTAAVTTPLRPDTDPSRHPFSDEALQAAWPASWVDAWSTALLVAPELPLPARLHGVLEMPHTKGTTRWVPCGEEDSPFQLASPNLRDPVLPPGPPPA